MSTKIADRVSSLVSEAGRIERESEAVYLEMGIVFPRLSAEMGKSVETGERSLSSLSAAVQAGLGAQTANGAFDLDEARNFFHALRERDAALLTKINEGISRLGTMDEVIARVRGDSEEMEIISLNAMTVALKSGADGKAFSVITDELKRLSGRTIVLAEGVTASGRTLLDSFARFGEALAELEDFQRSFFDDIDRTLGSGYEEVRRECSEATAFFSKLLEEARKMREPVLRVMNEVQLQDIVRQGLQHVGISLEEARASAAADDEGSDAFTAAVAELSEGLIADIFDKLEASASSFGADMEAVNGIVQASEASRADFLGGGRSGLASGASGGGAGAGEASDFSRRSERYLELKRAVVTMSSRLSDQVKGLSGSFKGLSALLARFQNIVVASRIEVAKTKALAVVATTVGGMISLTARIETDLGEAMETTKAFTALSSGAIAEYSLRSEAEGEVLISTLATADRDMKRLFGAKTALRESIDDFSLYTDEFIALIGRADEALAKLRALTGGLRSVDESLRDLRAAISEDLGPDAQALESDRIRRMVERFTIFTHKKAAGDIARFAVEEGRDAGEVTLF
jgi:hypothetical protein